MRVNLFYPAVALIGIALFFLFQPPAAEQLSFFGFAESSETTLNYNYPVVVDEILARPGQSVEKGQTLLLISRRKSKEALADQQFRIAELRSEEQLWRQGKQGDLTQLGLRANSELAGLETELEETRAELSYKRSLSEGLSTLTAPEASYLPLEQKINRLTAEIARKQELITAREEGLKSELRLGGNPYREQIRRLEAEMTFEEEQMVRSFTVTAPADGLVGSVDVRLGEHVPSYQTLLTFYEPHSNLVRGYVHEDQTMRVSIGDAFEVYSLKVPDVVYAATVTGLGSRIVETPTRLRKLPDFKTYGREVVLEIPAANEFLQKEKVGIRATSPSK